jgi:hypothetical protein
MDMSHEFIQGQQGSSLDIEGEFMGLLRRVQFQRAFRSLRRVRLERSDYFAEFPLDYSRPCRTPSSQSMPSRRLFTNFKAVYVSSIDLPLRRVRYGWTSVD